MTFISLRSFFTIVLASTFFLAPLVRGNRATKPSLTCFLKSLQASRLAGATPKTNQPRSEVIRQYLADIFGVPGFKTLWYENITDVQVTGDTATVKTNLSSGDKKISQVCGVVSGFVYSHLNAQLGITKIKILGRSGEILVFRKSVLDDCPP